MRPDSSCSPGVFKSSVDAELGAIGAASELSGTLVSELDVCAVVICWAKEVEQRWWWWWWHHLETMPRQTHLRARIISHNPLPAFQGFPAASWSDVLCSVFNAKTLTLGLLVTAYFLLMRGVEWYFILWSSPGNVEILLCTWSFSFTCTFSFLCTLDTHVVMHLLLFIPAEKSSVGFFKCLQAWPDIITGSTVEPDVVYFCLYEKLLALQVKTQLFHCSVDKLRHQTGNWLSHELCEVVCMQLALCITEQVSYNLGASNLVKIDLWSIRGMGRTRIGLGHHPGSLPLVWTWEPFSVWRGNVPAGENKSAYVTS